jgi:hypothetical protein
MNKRQVKAVTKFIAMFEKVHVLQKKNHEIKKLEIHEEPCSVSIIIQAGKKGEDRSSRYITSIVGIGYDGYTVGYDKKFRKLEGLFNNLFQS